MTRQIVILGASGDLTRRKLMPALTNLDANGRAGQAFSVIGVARREKAETYVACATALCVRFVPMC